MNFAITIAAAGTYDFPGALHKINLLCIENSGAGDVYLGAIPPVVISRYGNTSTALTYAELVTDSGGATADGAAATNAIYPGMIVSHIDAITVGTKVLYCIGNKVYMDQVAAETTEPALLVFTPPAIDATTGITIPAGDRLWLTAAAHAYFLQQGFRLYSTDGTTIKFMPKYN